MPSTTIRHSKQTPIPQTGVRCSPVVEVLQATPAVSAATAADVPSDTSTILPFTRTWTFSGMRGFLHLARRQVWLRRNLSSAAEERVGDQPCGSERSRDPKTFVTGCEVDG